MSLNSCSYRSVTNSVSLFLCFCFFTSDGVETFSQFLRTEFSEENIEFWLACEEYKTTDSETKLLSKAKYIYTIFIESDAPKEVWHMPFFTSQTAWMLYC